MSHSSAELESLNDGITSILEKPFISSTVVLVISWTTFIISCSLPNFRDVGMEGWQVCLHPEDYHEQCVGYPMVAMTTCNAVYNYVILLDLILTDLCAYQGVSIVTHVLRV